MPCGGSAQVFAFTSLSATSQLSLASCMTTNSLLDFAIASPEFMIFLRIRCEEIVLAALRTQYGYIPDPSSWDRCHHLPLYTNQAHPHPHLHRTPARRRHKRANLDATELLHELPMLQWLIDEEQLPENGRKILELLPKSEHSYRLYGAGIRGLLRYCDEYTAASSSLVGKRDIHDQMKKWLQDRYTNWGINEIWFVIDALGSHIDELLPSLRNSGQAQREQLLGALLCNLEVLRLPSIHDGISTVTEEDTLRVLLNRGVIEFPGIFSSEVRLVEHSWEVRDGSHSQWFVVPAQDALEGKQASCSQSIYSSSESLSVANYVLGHGQEQDQASILPRYRLDLESMVLMTAEAAAKASGTTRAKNIGFQGEVWDGQGSFGD